ncbi:hypothetical protein C8J56DRAFT_1051170 [Mycena floridula]|nr:hypothetical protein C8J56DRAFT_1051170 [Mycena floridula]
MNALQGYALHPLSGYLPNYNVNYASQLVVDTFRLAQGFFMPYFSPLPSASDLKALASVFKHNS